MTSSAWQQQFKLTPPDGGWGYAIVGAATLIVICSLIPMGGFGIVFGSFLSKVGDETTGTSLANGIFNTVMSFTGLLTNVLLRKYSCRTVGLVGAILYSIGAFGIVFVQTLVQFVIFFGVIQGVGFGLLFPASCTAFNSYFDKKMNLMMSISQTIMGVANMVVPLTEAFLMNYYGFRGTVALIAALSLFNVPATAVMYPVTKYLKKVPLEQLNNVEIRNSDHPERSKSLTTDILSLQIQPILYSFKSNSYKNVQKSTKYNSDMLEAKSTLMSLGDRATSAQTIYAYQKHNNMNRASREREPLMDLSLFKDPVYMNIATGLSLSFTADLAFISIIPLLLNGLNFSTDEAAIMLMVFFGADLISRIVLSVMSVFWSIRNRYLFWCGSLFTALVRMAFVLNDSYSWKISTLGVMGFFRGFIQTPLILVISDEYSENFASAFSLYMVVCGFVSLICGPLMSLIKSSTGSDVIVCHLLTAALLLCVSSWLVEYVWEVKRKSQRKQ